MAEKPEPSTRTALLSAAQSLCNDFSSASPISTLLSHFADPPSSNSDAPSAYEHGNSSVAPFLGRLFLGRAGIEEYFQLLQKYVTFEKMRFSDYVADEVEKVVCVRGQARFTWKETGKGWDEVFTYRLGLVEEGKVWKVSRYEVWADSYSL